MNGLRKTTGSLCLLLVGGLGTAGSSRAQEGPPPVLVATAPVGQERVTEKVAFLGTVRPILDSLVAAEVEGRVATRLVENGDRVGQGKPLVKLDAKRLEKALAVARAQRDDVSAQLDLARTQETRALDLHGDGALSAGDRDIAVHTRRSLEARLASLTASIDSIEDDIERTVIRAPFAGIVTEVRTEIGEWIQRGSPVVRLSNLDTLEIELEVPGSYYPFVQRGDPAPTAVDALDDLVLDGEIFAVVPRADDESRTFPVLVRAANPEGRVGAGMLTRVELTVSTASDALVVPKDALVGLAQQQIVFLVEDGTAKAVTVRTGRAVGDRVEVFGELQVGQRVVVRGNERLGPGQKVYEDTTAARADGVPND